MLYIHCKENNITKVYKWSDIIKYVHENDVKLMIIDIDGVILSENIEDTLTESTLPTELKNLHDQGIFLFFLTARPHIYMFKQKINNNFSGTNKSLNKLWIFPHEIRMTNRRDKGQFVQHILLENPNKKAIFIDNDTHQVNNVASLNDIPVFHYLGDKVQK